MNILWNELKQANSGLTDTELFQLALDTPTDDQKLFKLDLQGNYIEIEEDLRLKKVFGRKNWIDLNYGVIDIKNPEASIRPELPPNLRVGAGGQEDDIMRYMDKWKVTDGHVKGGHIQFRIQGSEESHIENVEFYRGGMGVSVEFGLRTTIEKCRFESQSNLGVSLGSGDLFLLNGNGDNSASNHSTVSNCRFIAGAGEPSGVSSFGCNAILIDRTIFEGGKYDDIILAVENGNTNRTFTVRDCHIESPSNRAMAVRMKRRIQIEGYFNQMQGVVQLDAPNINIIAPSFIKNGSKFIKGNTGKWLFTQVETNFMDAKWWDGDRPSNIVIDNGDKIHTRKSMSFTQGEQEEMKVVYLPYYHSNGNVYKGRLDVGSYTEIVKKENLKIIEK